MIYNDIALFTAVARHLNFSAAASESGIPLSRISRRIAQLEAHLGVKLFERTTRQVRLTEEGRRLLDLCQGPIEALGDITGLAADAHRPTIRITAPPLAARTSIGPRLLDFLVARPELRVDLTATNLVLDFFRDNIDLAFRLGPLTDSSLVARRLWSVPYCFCSGTGFAARHRLDAPIRTARLLGLPAIVSRQPWRLESGETARPVNMVHEFDDLEIARAAVLRDLGVAMLPLDMAREKLHIITLSDAAPLSRDMFAVYPSKRLLPRRVRDLIDFMAQA
tara:strand:+ start:24930 stop:25766 length:837 start_codon:yes stop_codon:yes gene_type:complete